MTAYYLLTGETPFDGLSMAQIVARKLHGSPQDLELPRASASEHSCSLVRWMMQREPQDRPTHYEVIFQRIDEILPQLPNDSVHASDVLGLSESSAILTSVDRFSATQLVHAPTTTGELAARGPNQLAATVDAAHAGATPQALGAAVPAAQPATRFSRRHLFVAGMSTALLAAGIIASRRRRPRPASNWVTADWAIQCYDGQTLNGWTINHGQWVPGVPNDDGGRVLAGNQGAISFPLTRPDEWARLFRCVDSASSRWFSLDSLLLRKCNGRSWEASSRKPLHDMWCESIPSR